jgi:hypothetical protein
VIGYVPSSSGCEPTPCLHPALPDDGQGGVGNITDHEPRNQHDRSAHAEGKDQRKTNKTTNVVPVMLRSWQTESTANTKEFVRHP